jgi:gamma-glutamylcyclotransferase (GGCT)/AIG2-like uncharacterized protein YtfP
MGRSKRSKNAKKNMRNINKRSEDYKTKAELKKEFKRLQKQNKMEKKFLVGFYDNYRKEGDSHNVLEVNNSVLIGTYSTEPEYTMFDLEGTDCVVKDFGETSIKIEIWEVNQKVLNKVEQTYYRYEGVQESQQVYNKLQIESPYGEILLYLYNDIIDLGEKIQNGDWIEHCIYQKAIGKNNKKVLDSMLEKLKNVIAINK